MFRPPDAGGVFVHVAIHWLVLVRLHRTPVLDSRRAPLNMLILSLLLLLSCAMVAALQAFLCLRLVAAFRRPAPALLLDSECPPVLAVLCLRGTDPYLPRTLKQLFTLDYPDVRVRVVIDSPSDPVLQLVEEVRRDLDAKHVEILTLSHHDELCSAKMSSLLLATEDLPPETQVVATFDGDCVLHATCLRELVTPLVRDGVAVSTGNRWFAPASCSLGEVARFQWNLGCVPLMTQLGLPWGGCLAMQRPVIEDRQVREKYAGAFAEDMLLGSLMRQRSEQVVFVPRATIVNREGISLKGVLNFLTRQMLCVRLHHHQWKRIVAWGCLFSTLGGVICPIGLLVAPLRLASATGLALLFLTSLVSMSWMGLCVRRVVGERGESLVRLTPRFLATMVLATPLTQWLTLMANIRAIIARPVTWRGLTYRFAESPRVQLIHEVPVEDLFVAEIATSGLSRPRPRSAALQDSPAESTTSMR